MQRTIACMALRVLHVGKYYPPSRGGIETHLAELCHGLVGKIDQLVVVAKDQGPTIRERIDAVDVVRLRTLLRFGGAPVCPGLSQVMRDSRADIIHVHLPNPAAVLSYLYARHAGALVVTYHSDIVRQRVLGALFSPILHHFLDRADAIIAPTEYHIRNSSVLRKYEEKCRIVPYGMRVDTTPVNEEELLPTDALRPMILAVGRLVGYKGFDVLIHAMVRVDAHLIIVGDGPERAALEALIQRLGLRERVTMLGAVTNLRRYYNAARLFVLPSVSSNEAFGLVQLEAMAWGIPVVNTALPTAVPHVSLDGETGKTVPPRDAEALGTAINELLADERQCQRMGIAGRRRFSERFGVETMAERALDVYEEVATGT